MPQIFYSRLNPVNFYRQAATQLPQYDSKDMDNFMFQSRLTVLDTPVTYDHPWTIHDAITLQFICDFAPVQLNLINCDYSIVKSSVASQKRADMDRPTFYIYEVTMTMAGVTPGRYWLQLSLSSGQELWISEPQYIHNELPGSLYLQYQNSRMHGGVIFETGVVFNFRVEGILDDFDPGDVRTSYRDQRLNPTTLSAIPFRAWTFNFGPTYGIPDWMGDKLNWIWSCDTVMSDGVLYAISEDSKLESQVLDQAYKLRHYRLKVQEGYNKNGMTVGVPLDPNGRFIVGILIDSTIIGDTYDPGQDLISITSVD